MTYKEASEQLAEAVEILFNHIGPYNDYDVDIISPKRIGTPTIWHAYIDGFWRKEDGFGESMNADRVNSLLEKIKRLIVKYGPMEGDFVRLRYTGDNDYQRIVEGTVIDYTSVDPDDKYIYISENGKVGNVRVPKDKMTIVSINGLKL